MTDLPYMQDMPLEEIPILDAALNDSRDMWRIFGAAVYVRLRAVTGSPVQDCASLAAEIIDALRVEFGGMQPYLPSNKDIILSERDRQIVSEYNGRNLSALAQKYELTPRRLHTIIVTQRREDFERRQGKLGL